MAGSVQISVADSITHAGRQAWERLAHQAPVFYGYDFLHSIEHLPLSAGAKAYYVLAHDRQGRLVAGLPLYFAEARDPFASDPGSPAVRILAGHLWHCYDTCLPSRVPVGPDLVRALWSRVQDLADDVGAGPRGLVNLPLNGPLAKRLQHLGVHIVETAPRYRLPLPGRRYTINDHLAGVGRASRRTLRKYCRRAAEAGVRISCEEPAVALDEAVLELCVLTADKHAPGYYPPRELAALLNALGPACRILRIELDGMLLATSICLLDRNRAHFWAGGCRYPAGLNWSPQYVLFAAELERGLASGKPMLEFGRRNDEFKLRYGLIAERLGKAIT